jgi:hypothetical protein
MLAKRFVQRVPSALTTVKIIRAGSIACGTILEAAEYSRERRSL